MNFGTQTSKLIQEKLVTFVEASVTDSNFTEIFDDPCIEQVLPSHPYLATWLRRDTKANHVAKGTKHLDDGYWRNGYHGTTVTAAIKSTGDGFKVGLGRTSNKEGISFHQTLGSTGAYTGMASLDPFGSAYVWGAVVECHVNQTTDTASHQPVPRKSIGFNLKSRYRS